MRTGRYVYAAGSIAAGVLDLVWREFEAAHQPIQALSDHIPGRELLACLAGVCLIAGGAAIIWQRTARFGAWILGVIYFLFAAFWLPRFYTAPHAIGFRIPVMVGLLAGVAQQAILVAAAAIVAGSRSRLLIRWTFGASSIVFGLAHLTGLRDVAAMVPAWMPPGGEFWAVVTGVAFALAGIAILCGIQDVLAARLLALMLLIFSALVLAPRALAIAPNHVRWGSNAYNLAAVGASWLLADYLRAKR